MKIIRIILLPLAVVYGIIVFLRNKLYDWGIFSSKENALATISVGNLTVGGTGKTPHIEYLIRLLKTEYYIATLSRGYGRKTTGFILSDTQSTASDIGDEPLQFKKKFNGIRVAVDENRVRGVEKLIANSPSLQTILLDDAFQHRAIKPGLSIILTEYGKLYTTDFLLPSGRLREFKSGAKRADIIIVSKCPEILLPIERKRLYSEINPLPHQKVYFSYLKYGDFVHLKNENTPFSKEYYFEHNYSAVLLTGIANTTALEYYLKGKVKNIIPAKFSDHHTFTKNDLQKVKKIFNDVPSANKIILTTEKDAMRLQTPAFKKITEGLPIFYIPIMVDFHDNDTTEFNDQIINYVRTNKKYNNFHSK
jgi:tetraacyldisaccharide 4'-kinase